ncbi:hypothetical protein A2U01_0097547, partial [Trifolium medium]|nr:hypothetical protein [Trifolium medium]
MVLIDMVSGISTLNGGAPSTLVHRIQELI